MAKAAGTQEACCVQPAMLQRVECCAMFYSSAPNRTKFFEDFVTTRLENRQRVTSPTDMISASFHRSYR